MAIRQIRLRGHKHWQARVQFKSKRASRLCGSREEAVQAEAELLQELNAEVRQAEAEGAQPATLQLLCEAYEAELESRGKGTDTVGRAVTTRKALEAICPEFMKQPLSKIKEANIFAFRQARVRAGI